MEADSFEGPETLSFTMIMAIEPYVELLLLSQER